MSCWAIIPVRRAGQGKRRLAGVLAPARRRALVDAMLARVLAAAAAPGIARVCVIGGRGFRLPPGVTRLPDPGRGLNAALAQARALIAAQGASRMIVLAADLPHVTRTEAMRLADLPEGTLGLAPDRRGTGTNALSLPLPWALRLRFAYGPGSAHRHARQARQLGLALARLRSPGLALDIDLPSDLPDLGPPTLSPRRTARRIAP